MFSSHKLKQIYHNIHQSGVKASTHSTGLKGAYMVLSNRRIALALIVIIGYFAVLYHLNRGMEETSLDSTSKYHFGVDEKTSQVPTTENKKHHPSVDASNDFEDKVEMVLKRLPVDRIPAEKKGKENSKVSQRERVGKQARKSPQCSSNPFYVVDLNKIIGPGSADAEKMETVKNMMKHAWTGYRKYAWGYDELKPISKTGRNWVTPNGMSASIVDVLDTLKIMGLDSEFDEAADYFVTKVSLDQDSPVSFFETTIRVLGGLLSGYHFGGETDKRLLEKAKDVADRLSRAISSGDHLPNSLVNLKTGSSMSHGWTGNRLILAEIGSFQLEFTYLSDLTGDNKYRKFADDSIETIRKFQTSIPGLYPSYISSGTNQQSNAEYSMGGLADSFYEYLLKMYLYTDKEETKYKDMYDAAVNATLQYMVGTGRDDLKYLGMLSYGDRRHEMEHLTCFSGGMLALGAVTGTSENQEAFLTGSAIGETCYQMYHSQKTGLSPEKVRMSDIQPADGGASYYIERPETVETLFYLWRLTHQQKYRDWGWEIVQSMEKNLKVENGYSGLHNVNNLPPNHNDNQESFFLAETLKYLYLLFTDDDVVPLDKYVFNTEAHPFPIRKSKDCK